MRGRRGYSGLLNQTASHLYSTRTGGNHVLRCWVCADDEMAYFSGKMALKQTMGKPFTSLGF